MLKHLFTIAAASSRAQSVRQPDPMPRIRWYA
jgi:hypothetical protein